MIGQKIVALPAILYNLLLTCPAIVRAFGIVYCPVHSAWHGISFHTLHTYAQLRRREHPSGLDAADCWEGGRVTVSLRLR